MKLETLTRDTPFDGLRTSRACRGTLHEERVFLAMSSLDCARDPELCRRATNRHESCGRGDLLFAVAYNEFCAPTLEESLEELIEKGATHITVATTIFTPGGSHSEVEIPEILDHLRPQYPGLNSVTSGRST